MLKIQLAERFKTTHYLAMRSINLLILAMLLGAVSLSATDLRIKMLNHVDAKGVLSGDSPPSPGKILYVHGTVEREEFVGYVDGFQGPVGQQPPHMAVITHCDTGVGYEIDLDHHEYREFKLPKDPSAQQFEKQVEEAKKQAEKRSKSKTVDTGETRDFYGHTARHFITTVTTKSDYFRSEEVVDGWYVDSPAPGCAPEYMRRGRGQQITGARGHSIPDNRYYTGYTGSPSRMPMVDSAPRNLFIYTGFMPEGWAIEQKIVNHYVVIRHWDETSGESVQEQRVIEFSESPLDSSLFEVPSGFDKVKELYKHLKR